MTSNYSDVKTADYTFDVFVEDEFDEEDLKPVYDVGIKCNACFGTGLDRYEDVDCIECWGEGYV